MSWQTSLVFIDVLFIQKKRFSCRISFWRQLFPSTWKHEIWLLTTNPHEVRQSLFVCGDYHRASQTSSKPNGYLGKENLANETIEFYTKVVKINIFHLQLQRILVKSIPLYNEENRHWWMFCGHELHWLKNVQMLSLVPRLLYLLCYCPRPPSASFTTHVCQEIQPKSKCVSFCDYNTVNDHNLEP